jgi:hypothetical protein
MNMNKTSTINPAWPLALLAITATAGCALLTGNDPAEAQSTVSLAAPPKHDAAVYFEEDFKNYGTTAPTLVDAGGIDLDNDPIWTQSAAANFNLEQAGLVLKEYSPSALPATLKNYDVLFKFRLREREGALGKFDARLRLSQNGKLGDVIVSISTGEVTLGSKGLSPSVTGGATLPFALEKNAWHEAALTVRGDQLTVYIDNNRVLQQIVQATIPAATSAGVNFFAFPASPFSLTNLIVRAAAPLPNHTITNILPTPQTVNEADFKTGATQTVAANDLFGTTLRTGLEEGGVKLTVNWNDGTSKEISFTTTGIPDSRKIQKDGKTVTEKFERPDAIIQMKGLGDAKSKLDYYIRPRLRRYHTSYSFTDTYHDIVRDWELLPKASEHPLKVELRRTASGADLYLDSCYAGSLAGVGVKDATFTAGPTASLGKTFSQKTNFNTTRYEPLDVAALGMAKSFSDAKSTLQAGLSEVKGVPMFVASGAGSADIGLTREGQGNWALEVDEYLARQPFDGLLSEVHFTVPGKALYTKAWVLAAVDPDPAKDPLLTTRITRYVENGIGGNRLADTTITLPRGDQKPGAGVVPVGHVSKSANGKKVEVPLYLVEVPLDSGKIADIEMNEASLNFEFFGKPWENFEQINNAIKPDPNSTSAVQIFGVTLEKAPVGLEMVQSQPGNIFANDEKPETTAVLTSLAPSKGKLAWEIFDVDGKPAGQGATEYAFAQAGEEKKVTIPLQMPAVGWYELKISLQDAAGKTLLTHPASFALLGKDERKARYDSPYSTWWFDGAHNTPKDIDFAGPVMFKAGIRKAGWTGQSEAAMAKYFLTKPQFNTPFKFDDLKNPEAAYAKAEKSLNDLVAKYPHTKEVAVFHESGPGNDIPMELIGMKPDNMTPDRIAREKRYADLLNMSGQFFREKFPQLKLVVGNISASQSNIAAILRHGGNPDYIDYIGIESPSQVYTPEKLQEWALQGNHMARDVAKVLSGRDIPATGCYEFTYRSERDMGQQQQAQWYARDVLISLANNFTTISPGILFDTSNSYYNGLWGGSGILERAPYGYPKKAYVAYATLTNVLDQVTFKKQIPTGSTTVYAVEFNRADNKLATALWAARGEADFDITFAGDTAVRVVEMYGRSKEQKTNGGKLTVRAGASPVYLLADKEIKSITLSNRSFPKDEVRAQATTVAAPFDSTATVQLVDDHSLDTPKTFPLQTPIRQAGEFALRAVKDDVKGDALELELKTDQTPQLSKYITEYATLRLSTPAAIEGAPAALGVWIKGNSNWGRPLFEIEDANGEVWRSIGTGGWGCDILDWPGNLATNFDGWNFVALPLRDTKLFNDHSPGPVSEQWVSSGGDKKIDYPLKLRALTIEMNRTPLDLTDFKTAAPTIRIKDVSGIYSSE